MLHTLIGALRTTLGAIDAEIAASADGAELVDLALALDELREARRELGMVHDSVEGAVVDRMGKRWERTLDGFGTLRVRGGKSRTAWDHDTLFGLALDRARSVEPLAINGRDETEAEAALRIVRSAAHVDYWRSKVLKGWGIVPDEYCSVTWGRRTVEVVR